MKHKLDRSFVVNVLIFAMLLVSCSPSQPTPSAAAQETTPTVISGSGDISAVVEQYRTLLGADNGVEPGSKGPSGYREINWDGVPDELAAPNFLPADFFNAPEAPRARGAFFSTPGDGIQVSADSDIPPAQHHISRTSTLVTHSRPLAKSDYFRQSAAMLST